MALKMTAFTGRSLLFKRFLSVSALARSSEAAAQAPGAGTPFTTIRDKITEKTYDSITVKPFKFTEMSEVQSRVFKLLPGISDVYQRGQPPSADRVDLLVKAKTGTGKTLAFLVPAIEARVKRLAVEGPNALQFAKQNVGTLIVSPTRELATQIATEASQLSKSHGFKVYLFIGGDYKSVQLGSWKRDTKDIVVCTPGRLLDLASSMPGFSDALAGTSNLILDEADTLLDMGFGKDVERIAAYCPKAPHRQTSLFSATVSSNIKSIAHKTLAPGYVSMDCVPKDESNVHAHIPQYFTVMKNPAEYLPHLMRLILQDQMTNVSKSKIIIFCPTTRTTQLYSDIMRSMASSMIGSGIRKNIFEIHSKKDQAIRTNTSSRFRACTNGILVTSDVSARGVDYPGTTRVIQLGAATSGDIYIHRVGRTGRANQAGRGDLLLLPFEANFVTKMLKQVPIKPLQTHELAEQCQQEAKRDQRYTVALENMEEQCKLFIQEADDHISPDVEEAAKSQLTYYANMKGGLKISGKSMFEGICEQWATLSMGLARGVRVSKQMTKFLGLASNDINGPSIILQDRGITSSSRGQGDFSGGGKFSNRGGPLGGGYRGGGSRDGSRSPSPYASRGGSERPGRY